MTSFYLLVDEIVPAGKFQFRVRMWRQAGFPPLVLYTQIPGQPAPKYFISYLGNFVLRGFLGYALPIPVLFELSKARKETRAFRVRYETNGCDLRPILHKPKFTRLDPSAVEKLFGVKLDTLLKEFP
jgi:hypothetical protein